ncbi:Mitochondrial import inner membrane translocase subunit tim8 [Coemansia sp. Benny D115]|nr:Mitochondrial import inner membrane translocase subunit tim8 [Coemansia sp. Benny D115]
MAGDSNAPNVDFTITEVSVTRRFVKMSTQMDPAIQREMQEFIQQTSAKAQMQASIHEFNNRCWNTCITNANSNSLNSTEAACLKNCVHRFVETSKLIVDHLSKNF